MKIFVAILVMLAVGFPAWAGTDTVKEKPPAIEKAPLDPTCNRCCCTDVDNKRMPISQCNKDCIRLEELSEKQRKLPDVKNAAEEALEALFAETYILAHAMCVDNCDKAALLRVFERKYHFSIRRTDEPEPAKCPNP
jgi:hypothetical protein